MNAEDLKSLQAPLKQKYKDDPGAAVVTLRAEGHATGLSCKVATGKALVEAGDIRLRFNLDTDASEDQRATLIRLTERYCVVLQTLRTPPQVSVVEVAL